MLVVGPGSIGRLLACRWALGGVKVRLLARTARQEAALSRGLVLTDAAGRSRLVRGLTSARLDRPSPPPAAVFFCVKAGQVAAAIRASRPWIGPETVVVTLQNGLGHEDAFRAAFGSSRTVVGSAFIAAAAEGLRGVAHTGGRRVLVAAGADNRRAARTAARLLTAGGWKVRLVRDEARMLWTKLVTNASVNLLGAAAAAPNGALTREPGLAAVLGILVREGTRTARASGHPPLYSLERTIPAACRNSGKQSNSMLQDLRAGRRTESWAIAGPILAACRRLRVPAPGLELLAGVVGRLERTATSKRKT